MKKLLPAVLLLLLSCPTLNARDHKSRIDSVLTVLDREIENREMYYGSRELRIENMKSNLNGRPSPPHEKIAIYDRIFNEYKSYQFDSAYVYASKMLDAAEELGSDSLKERAHYNLLFAYTSTGLFADATELVRTADVSHMSDQHKAEFYNLCIRLYSDMSNFLNKKFSDEYARICWKYCDSVLMTATPDSFLYQYVSTFQTIGGDDTDAKIAAFERLLRTVDMDSSQKAIINSVIGDFYWEKGDLVNASVYKAESSILDIRSAIRETSAKRDLAMNLYDLGDIERASFYIQLALEDANFYNARHRKMEICQILPAIEHNRYQTIASQRRRMISYGIVISVLCLLLLVFLILLYKQMKQRRFARETIEQRNRQIEEQNDRLSETIRQLKESEQIKNEYIGNIFYQDALHIDKLERIYRTVNRKIAAKQYDDLRMVFNDTDLQKEREQIYASFDAGLLRLFPTFVQKYNALFEPGSRPCADDCQTLTPEMRIFALIRLGITDTERIAKFLNYSVHTINTYKTKAKNRSIVPNAQFEQRIMEIESEI